VGKVQGRCYGGWVAARVLRRAAAAISLLLLACFTASASAIVYDPADEWLPNTPGATWTWSWSDSQYATTPTKEQYTLGQTQGNAFTLDWTTDGQGNGDGTVQSAGEMGFTRSALGLINTGWSSSPPPPQFPILCAQASGCGNSLASTLFMAIWGTRSPVIAEPLLKGTRWSATGGADNDVQSDNRYIGMEKVTVPAFPAGVSAARVKSEVTQAGAIGDPYGSGIRTVWWVRGVGPVKIEFRHTGGEIGTAELQTTNQVPKAAPSDVNYLPLNRGQKFTLRWRNSKHMKKASVQQFTVTQVVNNTARVDVASKSGPIKVAGAYAFSTRLTGITNVATATKAASLAKFPKLGRRRHFFTPFDLMTFGFNPILQAFPAPGQSWNAKAGGRDFSVFGVTGFTKVLGTRKIKTPAGRFTALAVESHLKQKGHRFGSGVRISYFAPDKGLVKLVFRHRDGSVSTVERIR
jgi:hypothetical protein